MVILLAIHGATLGHQPDNPPPSPPDSTTETAKQAEPAKKHVIIEGQITDNIGAGQQGVAVTVKWKSPEGAVGEIIATTTTDALGDFAVTTDKPTRGDVIVTFVKPQYAELTRELSVGDDEYPPYIAATLEGKLVVIGRVIDALTTQPLGGASVKLRSEYKEWHQKTDDQGRFEMKNVLPGRGELIVVAKGYGRQRHEVLQLEDFGEIVIGLKPERVVHIKLVNDLSEPIAGATIECLDQPRDDFRTAATDGDGSVTLRGLHFDAEALSVRLTHEDHVSDEQFDRLIKTPSDKAESTHELVMTRAGRVSGLVTDAATGKPLYGARVMTGEGHSDYTPRDWTDYSGRYTVTGVKPGRAILTVHFAGRAPELASLEVEPGKTATRDIKLGPAETLSGVVKTQDGDPAVGILVLATKWRGHATLGLRAQTGADGRFVIENAPSDEFEISVMARGSAVATRTVTAARDANIEITVSDAAADDDLPQRSWLNIGDTAPVLQVKTLGGESLDFSDLRGKTILLDFWATWCAPCVADISHLRALHEKYTHRDDFVMISVSLDEDETAVRNFIKKEKVSWHQVFGEEGGARAAVKRYRISAVPMVFLIGPDGKLVAVVPSGTAIIKKVEQFLKDTDPT